MKGGEGPMRLTLMSASGLAQVLAVSTLLALAACASGEAASNPQGDDRAQAKVVRGYSCTQSAIAGRYSCARSLDRQAQREAVAHAPASCRSCGNVLSN